MQNGDDIRALMAILERQQEDHQRQREMLMRIESHILRVQSSVGPNITLGFVKLVDATDHSHAIPMDVCDSFEVSLAINSVLEKLTHPVLFSDSKSSSSFYSNTTRLRLEFRDGIWSKDSMI
jgi:hypothetical protein